MFHERSRIRLVANSTDWPDRGRRGKMTNRGGANSIFGKLSAECRVTRCSWSILPSPRLITLYRVASWRKRREISVLLQPFASNAFGIRCGIRAGIDSPSNFNSRGIRALDEYKGKSFPRTCIHRLFHPTREFNSCH